MPWIIQGTEDLKYGRYFLKKFKKGVFFKIWCFSAIVFPSRWDDDFID